MNGRTNDSSNVVSRRRLLGTSGAGVLGGALGSMGLANTAAAHTSSLPESWDLEADVVILGSGGAGTTAAIEAARAGASVIIIEKATNPGGNTAHSGGVVYLGAGTARQLEHGVEDSVQNMYAYLEAQMGPTQDLERLRYFVENSVEHYNWLVESGIEFGTEFFTGKIIQPSGETGGLAFSGNEANSPFSEIATPAQRGHMPAGAGAAVYAALKATADTLPIEWHFNTQGEELLVDADGRVAGVVVRTGIADPSTPTEEGTPVSATPAADSMVLNVKANKGVVLATGGFQFNQEMLADHAPWYIGGYPLGGPHQGDDGSGIKMGAQIGGDAFNMSFASPWNFVYAPGELCQSILVDGMGRRFTAESNYGADTGDPIFRRNHGIGWLIMDQGVLDRATEAGALMSAPFATADTIEELAEQIGVPAAVLSAELAFYNEQAANGEDPIFHKHSEYVVPLETAPFYAFDYGINRGIAFITLGGLRANMNSEILDVWGNVIPGLYGAGRVAPGISQEYYVSGSALADCTFWGRVAGRSVAAV
jgi:3-oxo-5alpha-steroid 4-dehydrogenase